MTTISNRFAAAFAAVLLFAGSWSAIITVPVSPVAAHSHAAALA